MKKKPYIILDSLPLNPLTNSFFNELRKREESINEVSICLMINKFEAEERIHGLMKCKGWDFHVCADYLKANALSL